MRFTRGIPLLAAGAALALFAGACNKETLGPGTITDTTATTAALDGVRAAFQVQAFASFSALSGNIGVSAVAPRLGAVLAATLPHGSALAPYVKSAARMLAI